MDLILYFLYLSVYLAVGSIFAELSLGYHDRKKLGVIRQAYRKPIYVFITTLWPLYLVMFLYQCFNPKGGSLY